MSADKCGGVSILGTRGCARGGLFRVVWCAFLLALACEGVAQDQAPPAPAPAQQQQTPQEPAPQTDKKDDSPKSGITQAAQATKNFGVATFSKVRDWENGWLTGPYIGRDRELVAPTVRQRQQIYLQQTLTTPSAYFKRMFVAGFDQWRDWPSQWGQGWGAYGQRFASREGQFIAANSLANLGNAALHYEPRYDQCRCSGFWPRTRHAIMRNFLTYNQSEKELRPQWALYGGAMGGGLIVTSWLPHPRNAWAEGGRAVLIQGGIGAVQNFFTEFAGDINRKLGARNKPGATK
jgi:hypothetical protein